MTRQPRPRWADDIDDDDRSAPTDAAAGGREIANRSQFRTSVGTGSTPAQPMPFGPQTTGPRERNQATAAIGVEAHAHLDGQRAQTQRLEDIRNLPRTVDPDELQSG